MVIEYPRGKSGGEKYSRSNNRSDHRLGRHGLRYFHPSPSIRIPLSGSFRRGLLFTVFFLCLGVFSCSTDPSLEAFERAETLFSEGEYFGAAEAYMKVVEEFPDSTHAPASQYKTGLIYSNHLNNPRKALDAYSTLFFLYPESPEGILAHADIARIYSRLGDPRKAIEEYQILLEEDSAGRKDQYQYNIAMEYIKLNDLIQARVELNELLSSYPSSAMLPQAYQHIANTYYLEGNLKEAVAAFDIIITEFNDQHAVMEAKLGKALSLEEMGSLHEAMEILKDLEDEYPNKEAITTRIKLLKKRIKQGPRRRKVR